MVDEKRVVWVLGAGFSAALGGPMLANLLSGGSRLDIEARFPTTRFASLHTDEVNLVRDIYSHGDGAWRDAEEFIDYLDTAAVHRGTDTANPHLDRLARVARRSQPHRAMNIQELRLAARRLVAAECAGFLEAVDLMREQWQPFRAWARSLTPSDTVITFNYDLVVELLADANDVEARRVGLPLSTLKVLLPGQLDDPMTWRGCTPVLKLHGSLDWKKQFISTGAGAAPTMFIRRDHPLFALDCPEAELAIATPGPSKKREATGFRELWRLARKALTEADAVVFVGYRFPPTDADAREQLLKAIGDNGSPDNEKRPKQLSLHVVLGKSPDDADRLASLLHFVCRKDRDEARANTSRHHETGREYRFTVDVHPLYAQDFFTVARRDDL